MLNFVEKIARLLSLSGAILLLQACTSIPALMPTPNIMAHANAYPAASINPLHRSNLVDLLYITDRAPGLNEQGLLSYGSDRSASLAYGSALIGIGEGVSWDELVRVSTSSTRKKKLPYSSLGINELGRFPTTPYRFNLVDGRPVVDDDVQQLADEQTKILRHEITRRLALTELKEIVMFVHGYNNSFDYATFTLSGIWHFFGRQGVPISYSWPAAHGGLFGYFIDRESGEYTIYHLKETLRILFSIPEIEKIHIIAHSRGTDVTTTALRELLIESTAKEENTRAAFGISNLILAAPDLDFGIISQRLMAEKFAAAVNQITIYTAQTDKALGFAQRLMSGVRFGRVASNDLSETQNTIFANVGNVHIIEANQASGSLGHSYFHSNPAVSSDLIRVLQTSAKPGSAQRPLEHQGGNFWKIPDGYPADLSHIGNSN